VLGCVTTTVPTATLPVTVPALPTTSTTTPTTTTDGGTSGAGTGAGGSGSTTSTAANTTTTEHGASTPSAGLSVRIAVRVRGHGVNRAIELRLRLSKPARVSSLLSRSGRTLGRKRFSARAGTSVWRLRVARTVKPGAAKLGLTYRAATGEVAHSTQSLRLPR